MLGHGVVDLPIIIFDPPMLVELHDHSVSLSSVTNSTEDGSASMCVCVCVRT